MLIMVCSESDEAASTTSPHFDALAREVLARGACLRFKVRGQSMYPFIQDDDVVLVEPKNVRELNTGDIIFYRRPWGTYVIHRLIEKVDGSPSLVTKGDNLAYYDEPVPIEQVMGRVIQIEGRGRQIQLNKGMGWLLNGFMGRLSRGCNPAKARLKRNLGRIYWLVGGRLKM